MRLAAGILTIIGGFLGGTLLVGILKSMHIYGVLLYVPFSVAIIGGYYILKKKHYGFAMAGAICSMLFPFFGIPALLLLIKSKREFQG